MLRYDNQSNTTENPFSGSSDDDTGYVSKKGSSSPTSEFDESIQAMCDIYGQTPPRTRLNRKKRYMKQKFGGETRSLEKEAPSRVTIRRRNTLDNIIFNEMCDKADKDCANEVNDEIVKDRKSKRSLKVLRGSERDLKLDVEAAYSYSEKFDHCQASTPNHMKIETRNRFRCLRSKPVDVEEKKADSNIYHLTSILDDKESITQSPKTQSLTERKIFHDTFSFLISLGSTERNCRRQMSHEETRWQNELKDLIWLELQAHHADRSPMAQDEHLCKQREAVEGLLTEIMNYKYDPIASVKSTNTPWINVTTCSNDQMASPGSSPNIELGICPGCLSMYCRACARSQGEALQQIEGLLARLEAAEALYPSSQAFAAHYPLYKSTDFTDRVKAMCLWYNMTKHHRLKLQILGKLLMMLHTKKKIDDTGDSGISSRSSDMTDSSEHRQTLVRFEICNQEENSSPTDSNNSNNSSVLSFAQSWPSTPETSFTYVDDDKTDRLDFYLVEFDRHAYRKYIEDVLKTRGLRKSLNFLERLHTSVLRKARLTLEKGDVTESSNEEYEGDEELRRYGAWSPEARVLNLPSYRAAFVFLSRVPLDVVHEFLRMRLEQKPVQPSPLSVRQLMRELREGLKIACIHRDRFAAHTCAAVASENCENLFQEYVKDFDESLRAVFEVYLDYLQQWVEMVQHDSFHKNLIMDEWKFVKSIAKDILNGYEIAGAKFCAIAKIMIQQVNEFLNERPREIQETMEDWTDDQYSDRFQLMSVGREWQSMFVEAREKIVKSITLAKCLKCDIEKWSIFSPKVEESITVLKETVMDLRQDITNIILSFQRDLKKAKEPHTECDRFAMRSRVREILHQAYRMGFDYYKETCKLFALEEKAVLSRSLVSFAFLWMEFVRTRCERGRGLRPRWANQGLEFLSTVCEPRNTKHLTEEEFEELKTSMDRCISHVVGSANTVTCIETGNFKKLSHSRASSPCHTRSRAASISLSQKPKDALKSPEISTNSKKASSPNVVDGNVNTVINTSEPVVPRQERINRAIKKLEIDIEERLKSRELIGQVTDRKAVDRVRIKARRVTFTWQRGIKIGQGRFGKVYTIVNNQTGELLAMKEVQLQPGDYRAIRRVAEELQIFEGIQDKHLVRYYGLEIHREEMLIFMEFCAEGTLESLVAGSGNGLPESLVRKYTHQLLSAVEVLHSHGIVHRDIKTANIFLTDEGNCLKLGDFGSAVQIKAHTTMPGELQGFVGTQAYMAPEVFMKSESSGHGRAADIWSVGCCVIEMASGRRPWSDYDSNYQIMFKVGMGETPMLPKNLSIEGIDLIIKCLQHNPKKRWTASGLLTLPFAQTDEDYNADLSAPRYQA